jgi:hypothetical protein
MGRFIGSDSLSLLLRRFVAATKISEMRVSACVSDL